MISKRRGLVLCGTAAVCLAVAAPTRVADSGLKTWMSVFGGLTADLRAAFDIPAPGAKGPDPKSADLKLPDGTPEGADQEAGQPFKAPDSALKDPHTIAVASDKMLALGIDPAGILEAIAAYRLDNLDAGDALAAHMSNPVVRSALEWVAMREVPQKMSLVRLQTFTATHADWPASNWVRHQMESKLLRAPDKIAVERFFEASAPETPLGKLALAKALKATGRGADATKLARALFRENDLSTYTEGLVRAEFGSDLTKGDYKYRADRLLYKEKVVPALRYAAQAGPDVLALAKARAAVIAESSSDKAMAAVPDALRKDPGLILAQVQKLRRDGKFLEAAKLMETAPHDATQLIDGDEWWTERRVLARKLLDDGKVNAAYIMCAMNSAVSPEAKVEAEFHAGWIALRFMNDPARAAYHFGVAAKLAETPTSISRIAYWQGRTAEDSVDPAALPEAKIFYERAAAHGSTYYGQLARQVLGLTTDPVQEPTESALGGERIEAVRVIELLYAAGEKDAAYALAISAAGTLDDARQIGALAAVIAREQDAHLALTIGKLIGQRGIPVDPLAFPTFGIPAYEALQNSAAAPVVYSVARQESAFMPGVMSKAGAKGLMQMIDATAKHTALKAGLPFDSTRMLTDASFNAQLGAAHLGELISEQGGSLILTFAAYNAGGGRVKQWIDAYGDPRKPGVDPIDWVERIPFTETRNYVQRVMANVTMYQAIFADQAKADAARTAREAKL